MKKMQKSLMLVAAAAMAFVGCSKEDISDNAQPESGIKVTRSFTAEIAASRTTLNDAATRLKWTEGDQLGIFTDVTTDRNIESSVYAEGDTNFTAKIDAAAKKVYAYYPYFDTQEENHNPRTYENVSLYINDEQTQTEAGVLNGNMVGMYASATLIEGQNTVLTFTPIASIIAFNIYDADNNGDEVQDITFKPKTGEKLNGQMIYNLETGVTANTGSKEYAKVTLGTHYAVPAAKPADKSGYIYLAVTPKEYSAGGTFTVRTTKGSYEFTMTKPIDVSNVYAPVVIPMNLNKVRKQPPTVTHVFYDDFSKCTGTSSISDLYVSPEDYAYYYTNPYTKTGSIYPFDGAIRVGVSKTVGTLTTPALKLVEGTKTLKVTFYANGWKEGQPLNVTASKGTVSGGSELVMPMATTASEMMDKSEAAFFTVYVQDADATTTLTFALASTKVDKRFILDDLTVDVHDGPIVLAPAISAPDITDVPAAGVADQTFTFDIRNDAGYAATVACDGTVVTAATVDNATKTVTYTVSENTDTAAGREGEITITLDDAAHTSLTVKVSQSKFLPTSIVAEDILVPAVGVADATFTFDIKDGNGYDYVPEVSFDGCVTAASVDAAKKTVTYSVDANTTSAKRIGTITIALNDPVKTSKTINVEQAEAGSATWIVDYTFTAKSIGTGYAAHTGVAVNNGIKWTVTFGQGTYIGTNSNNKAKCKLGATYAKVGAPMGYAADQTQVAAIISEAAMANIGKVVVSGDTDSHNPDHISLVYSIDNETYTLVETQTYDKTAGNTWEFEAVPSAYYAVVMEYSGTDYMRTNNLKIEYSSKK